MVERTNAAVRPLPRIGVWPFRRVDWDALARADERRRERYRHELALVREWQRLGAALSNMTNAEALTVIEELCRGRRWTSNDVDRIRSLVTMHATQALAKNAVEPA